MKITKVIYWIATGALCALMLLSASMYFFKHEMVKAVFTTLVYPTYVIYPLGIAKILAVMAILSKKSKMLKEWAYAGLFYDFVLAVSAHIHVKDNEYIPALAAIFLLIISYMYDKKLFKS